MIFIFLNIFYNQDVIFSPDNLVYLLLKKIEGILNLPIDNK
ncbi:hypothetical protein RS022_01800 [Candidatus Phytoplasma rubi]|uniref:Uncharacterized protein n=1 Tax=Candidatus Phytoplasma rubi TaxID=399025 RepID=A0ABY7BRQ3_9MOLU|nr:hypothetical protein RS022_01800 [Candidatus Phytoplasma rubi]